MLTAFCLGLLVALAIVAALFLTHASVVSKIKTDIAAVEQKVKDEAAKIRSDTKRYIDSLPRSSYAHALNAAPLLRRITDADVGKTSDDAAGQPAQINPTTAAASPAVVSATVEAPPATSVVNTKADPVPQPAA